MFNGAECCNVRVLVYCVSTCTCIWNIEAPPRCLYMYVYVLALYSSVVCMSVCVEVLSMNSFLLLIACVIMPEHCVHTLTGYHPFFQFNTLSLLLFCLHLHVALDYAHESVGFLTWHRIYLLWFEREMQILLGDNQFTVRYWDWTIPGNRNALFVSNKLGVSDDNGKVTGDLLSSWYLVCVDANGILPSEIQYVTLPQHQAITVLLGVESMLIATPYTGLMKQTLKEQSTILNSTELQPILTLRTNTT